MNHLSIVWQDSTDEEGVLWFDIVIDGLNLIELVRPIEEEILSNPRESGVAGGYGGNLLIEKLEAPAKNQTERSGTILICDCGCYGCWDLKCSIRRVDDVISWSDFRNNHRDWQYRGLGPFQFDASQYDLALNTN